MKPLFHMNVTDNTLNYKIWASMQPNIIHEIIFHSLKINVWLMQVPLIVLIFKKICGQQVAETYSVTAQKSAHVSNFYSSWTVGKTVPFSKTLRARWGYAYVGRVVQLLLCPPFKGVKVIRLYFRMIWLIDILICCYKISRFGIP